MITTPEKLMNEIEANWTGMEVPENIIRNDEINNNYGHWTYVIKLESKGDIKRHISIKIDLINKRPYTVYSDMKKNFTNPEKALKEAIVYLNYMVEKEKYYIQKEEERKVLREQRVKELEANGLTVDHISIKYNGEYMPAVLNHNGTIEFKACITPDQLVSFLKTLGKM